MEKDLYEILGIPRDAKIDLIKSVYRSLGQIYHPDKYQGDKMYAEEKMKEINEAYSILSNEKKRNEYDKKINFQSKPNNEKEFNTRANSFNEREDYYKRSSVKKETSTKSKNSRQNYDTQKHSLIDKIFGPNFLSDTVKIFLLGIGYMLLFALGTFIYFYAKYNYDFLIERIYDRFLFSSICGFLLGLFLYATDFKVNKFICVSKILGTTLLTVFLILLIPEQKDKKEINIKNDCKWTNAGRYSEPDC